MTSDIVDQFTDYVEILHECLPGLADAADPGDLRLDVAPDLRAVVLLGDKSPAGMVDRSAWDDAATAEGATEDDVHRRRTRVALRDVAMMLYTSGTTAMPKGCPLTSRGAGAHRRSWPVGPGSSSRPTTSCGTRCRCST